MRPNIVLFVMDTARASNFSAYGYEKETDSNFKRFAEEGIFFENAYANSIWTLPSHYSIFTGLLPSHHGVTSKDVRNTDKETFIEELDEEGYYSFGISSNGFVSPLFGFKEMFDSFHFLGDSFDIEDKIPFPEDDIFKEIYEIDEDNWNSTLDKYLDLLKRSVKEPSIKPILNGFYYLWNNKFDFQIDDGAAKSNRMFMEEMEESEGPFFGFVNYVEPHDPYKPPKEYAEKFLSDDVSYEEAMRVADDADLIEYMRDGAPDEAEVLQDLYDAEIAYLDNRIGELVEDVRERTERKTIFIITSDHGENFENDLWGHYGKITENLIHVPLVILGAGKDNISENFSLRNLRKIIEHLSEDDIEIDTSEKVISEYWGLESHTWDLEKDGLSEIYFENQKSLIGERLYLWTESEDTGENQKKYLQMRAGEP